MVLVLRRHVGEYDPNHPIYCNKQDGSQRQNSVNPPPKPIFLALIIKCFVHLDSFLKPFLVSVVEATETNVKVDLNIYGRKKEHLYLKKGHLCQPFPLRLCNKILAKHISQFLHLASNQCLSSTNLSGKQERSRRRDISQ